MSQGLRVCASQCGFQAHLAVSSMAQYLGAFSSWEGVRVGEFEAGGSSVFDGWECLVSALRPMAEDLTGSVLLPTCVSFLL